MMARALVEASGLSLQALATPRRRARPIVPLKALRHSSKRTLPHAIQREAPVSLGGSDRFLSYDARTCKTLFIFGKTAFHAESTPRSSNEWGVVKRSRARFSSMSAWR